MVDRFGVLLKQTQGAIHHKIVGLCRTDRQVLPGFTQSPQLIRGNQREIHVSVEFEPDAEKLLTFKVPVFQNRELLQ